MQEHTRLDAARDSRETIFDDNSNIIELYSMQYLLFHLFSTLIVLYPYNDHSRLIRTEMRFIRIAHAFNTSTP